MAAIYMWFEGQVQFVVLTTTPYPIEVIEELQIACAVSSGSMRLIPSDDHETGWTVIGGSLIQYLQSIGPFGPDDHETGWTVLSGTLNQVLESIGPYGPDDHETGWTVLSGTLEDLLVVADTPDESLDVSCAIYPSGCSMTPV